MTDREKAAMGMLYSSCEPEMCKERDRAKELCYDYNSLRPTQFDEQQKLLREIFGKTGEHIFVVQPFYCDYGYNIEAGDGFFMNGNCTILDCAKVIFGKNVLVGPNCGFYAVGHPIVADERNNYLEFALPITIGNDVWIGGSTVILPGVTIGDNTVIGAGSVVTKDIPSGVVAAGNPCKVIRPITDADRIPLDKPVK